MDFQPPNTVLATATLVEMSSLGAVSQRRIQRHATKGGHCGAYVQARLVDAAASPPLQLRGFLLPRVHDQDASRLEILYVPRDDTHAMMNSGSSDQPVGWRKRAPIATAGCPNTTPCPRNVSIDGQDPPLIATLEIVDPQLQGSTPVTLRQQLNPVPDLANRYSRHEHLTGSKTRKVVHDRRMGLRSLNL